MNPLNASADIITHIKEHRSVREYEKREISEKDLTKILESGIRASSSGNMQAYSIIVTKDINIRKELYPHHFNQEMVMDAPVLLTFSADFNRMRKWLDISNAPENFDNFMSFMIGSIDATLASQNCALAAESLGPGVCYMGTTLANAHKIGEVLNLPKNVVPIVGFSLGYPKGVTNKKDRLPLSSIVHEEKYQDYTTSEIQEIYREREQSGMKRYKDVRELNEKIEAGHIENLAQVYTKIKYTKESHELYSRNLFEYLKEQNFFN